ncbi:MAG: putative ABC transporter permease [Eubacterium sp.]
MYYNCCLLFTYFFLYAIIGWCCEVVFCSIPKKKFINRGFLNGPYCPIYGVGAIVIVSILGPYIDDPVSVFFVGIVSTSIIEYVTSWAMEKLFHAKWWDYSDKAFNINGRVCLRNSLLFGVMSLAVMYLVHPFVEDIIADFSKFWLEVAATFFAVLMVSDVITSTLETLNFKNKINRVSELATSVTDDLKDKGIETKTQITEKLSDAKSIKTHLLEKSKDNIQQHIENLNTKLSEKATLRRYSHNRIINAFPNMVSKEDPEAIELYRAALARTKKIRKLKKTQNKEAKKAQAK